MKAARHILYLALAVASCAKVDPGTIADPVSDGEHIMVTITVGRGAETRTGVSAAGQVSFTADDRLSLLQTVDHASGGSTTSLVQSGAPTLYGGGSSASFTFDISTAGIDAQDDITFRAATGDWSLPTGNDIMVDIPANLSPATYPSGSVLPLNGVIALSEPISASRSDISQALDGSVQLNHLVNYGMLNLSDIPSGAGTVTGITVSESSGAGLAGPATFDLATGAFMDAPSESVAITPSAGQQSQIASGSGTAIWFTRFPVGVTMDTPSLTVLLTDSNNNQWSGEFTPHISPDTPTPAPGSVSNIAISTWTPANP